MAIKVKHQVKQSNNQYATVYSETSADLVHYGQSTVENTLDSITKTLDGHMTNDTASTTQAGHVQLSDSINSASTVLGATANAVKKAYDLATSANASAIKANDAIGTHTHMYAGSSSEGGSATSALTCTGNSKTASQLQTARAISLSGDVVGNVSFGGDKDVDMSTTLSNSGVSAGSYGPTSATTVAFGGIMNVPNITVDSKGRITQATNAKMTISSATATTEVYGLAKLYDGVDSSSTVLAGTANAVKKAYDLANSANASATKANEAVSTHTHLYAGSASAGGSATSALECTGNSKTATTLATARKIALSGDLTGSVSFNGSADVSMTTTLSSSGATAGSYGPSANATPAFGGTFSVPYATVDAKGRITNIATKTITIPSTSASLTAKGIVQLCDDVDNDSKTLSATANAVKTVRDKIVASELALGEDASATGSCATAIGAKASTSGSASQAFGNLASATASYAIALGGEAIASGEYSVVLGSKATATNKQSTAIGHATTASGDWSVALGNRCTSSGSSSIAISAGKNDAKAAGNYSALLGFASITEGVGSIALGYKVSSIGNYSSVLGSLSTATGTYSSAIGRSNYPKGYGSVAIGYGNSTYDSNTVEAHFISDSTISHKSPYDYFYTYFFSQGLRMTSSSLPSVTQSGCNYIYSVQAISVGTKFTIYDEDTVYTITSITTATDKVTVTHLSTGVSSSATATYYILNLDVPLTRQLNSTTLYTGDYVDFTYANSDYSLAMGTSSVAKNTASKAIGYYTTARGRYQTVIGKYNEEQGEIESFSKSDYALIIGNGTSSTARSNAFAVDWYGNLILKPSSSDPVKISSSNGGLSISTIGKYAVTNSSSYGLAIGRYTSVSGMDSIGIGYNAKANASYCLAIGESPTVTGYGGVAVSACGAKTTASYGVSIGYYTTAQGYYGTALGYYTTANGHQLVAGRYNTASGETSSTWTTTDPLFILGNGSSSSSSSNAFRITKAGLVYSTGSYSTSGADYAEMFEWEDGNIEEEDRVGYFVSLEGNYIRKANSNDDYILGIVSANPSVVGDNPESWNDKYLTDEWGRPLKEWVEVEIEDPKKEKYKEDNDIDVLSDEEPEIAMEEHFIINPKYDASRQGSYIERSRRPEWAPVGMMGKLLVRDDGTCEVGKFCKPNDEGIATLAEGKDGYYVMDRISENIIKVLFR